MNFFVGEIGLILTFDLLIDGVVPDLTFGSPTITLEVPALGKSFVLTLDISVKGRVVYTTLAGDFSVGVHTAYVKYVIGSTQVLVGVPFKINVMADPT